MAVSLVLSVTVPPSAIASQASTLSFVIPSSTSLFACVWLCPEIASREPRRPLNAESADSRASVSAARLSATVFTAASRALVSAVRLSATVFTAASRAAVSAVRLSATAFTAASRAAVSAVRAASRAAVSAVIALLSSVLSACFK